MGSPTLSLGGYGYSFSVKTPLIILKRIKNIYSSKQLKKEHSKHGESVLTIGGYEIRLLSKYRKLRKRSNTSTGDSKLLNLIASVGSQDLSLDGYKFHLVAKYC